MDFIDWRKTPEQQKAEQQATNKYHGKRFDNYVEEQIREAEARGEFANLPGIGKPLSLSDHDPAGEMALAYRLLKNNHFAPPEIELLKEIDTERERAESRLAKVIHQSKTLRSRRLKPFEREKRAFNVSVERAAKEYEHRVREINSKILTLNIMAPSTLHRPLIEVKVLVQRFREQCPLFDV